MIEQILQVFVAVLLGTFLIYLFHVIAWSCSSVRLGAREDSRKLDAWTKYIEAKSAIASETSAWILARHKKRIANGMDGEASFEWYNREMSRLMDISERLPSYDDS